MNDNSINTKLSASTSLALANNFENVLGQDGKVGAFIKVSKNIDKELEELGVHINPKNQNSLLFTIRFAPTSLIQLAEIRGLDYIDVGNQVATRPFFNEDLAKYMERYKNKYPPSSNNSPNKGEPYVFLKDFSFINSKNDESFSANMVTYKKDQIVYPFPSSPNVRYVVLPEFREAIDKGVLVKKEKINKNLSNNKTVIGLGLIVILYFTYKFITKK